ncbi:MAG: DoxX family protein [Bacteroidetes bacterium]|nr:DoxX family protein [Bacteroidota bacterium]MBU1717924.1 DoxX family protein [Bacteroidota bacterium]
MASLLGLIFIFSGYTKLFPVELFEYTFIDIGVGGWKTAPFLARLLIGLEFFVGILLLLNFRLKKFTLKGAIGLLIAFTIYLLWLIIIEGNQGNCKCFGNAIYMTPLESIWKNLIMIGILFLLYRFHPQFHWRFQKIIIIVALLASIATPFVLNPVDLNVAARMQDDAANYAVDLSPLYYQEDYPPPKEDLSKGKHIIAFMSLTCRHCRLAGYKMHVIAKRNPEIPFFLVLNGDDSMLEDFFTDTKASDIPYTMLLGENFINLAGVRLPAILWVEDSLVIRKTNYLAMEEEDIINWLNRE